MITAPLPANEAQRLQALYAYEILDTTEEQRFDDLTRLAAAICDTPISLISLVDSNRQWFKSRIGLDASETSRDVAFCAHAILRPVDVLVVPDAASDPRFASNPLVLGEPGIRFYAGAPLVAPGGEALGTLCVIDKLPRELPLSKFEALSALARIVVSQLELRRITKQLARERERLELALEAAQIAVFEWDVASGSVALSPQWNAIVGGGLQETRTSMAALRELVHVQDAPVLAAKVRALLQGEIDHYVAEHRVRTLSGSWKWIESRAKVVARRADGRAQRVMGTNLDISERKRLEEMKSEFIATASHELRTPLTSLVVSLNLLRENWPAETSPSTRQFLELACENSDRLTVLVNDLLDMERLESGQVKLKIERLELASLLAHAAALNGPYAERFGVRYRVECAAPLFVRADGERLAQVLANLLSNAAKFSPAGSEVVVRAQSASQRVRISVVDRGTGISPAMRERLFQKFSQLERADGRQKAGTGLGLAISKGLVEQMGGRIDFDSEVGVGSTFWIDLPAA